MQFLKFKSKMVPAIFPDIYNDSNLIIPDNHLLGWEWTYNPSSVLSGKREAGRGGRG